MNKLLQTRHVFVLVVAVGLFAMATRPLSDPDVWWHLKTGELIASSGHVFHSDPYSFTFAGAPWVNHEWLSEVLMYAVYQVAGKIGLSAFFGLVTTAGLLLLYQRCRHKPYLAGLLTVWGGLAGGPTWGARPQVFSFLLASLFLFVLESSPDHPRRLLWLPGLMLLWVNLHGGYAMGIALTTVFLVGCLIERWLGSNELADRSAYLRYLVLALLACLAIVPVNPIGFRMYRYPFETLGLTAIQKYIAEWASPNFHEVSYLPFMLLVLATLFAMGLADRRPRPREMLLFLFALAAALVSVRHIPVFALVAVPVLAAAIPDGVWDFREKRLFSRKGLKLAFNGIVALAIVGFAAARLHSVARNEVKVERETFPVAAMDVIVSEKLQTPILNHYNWGGYFIWKLYPGYRVFLDGRTDLYGDDFMHQFAAGYYLSDSSWREWLERWHIRTVLLPPDAPLTEALRSLPEWRQVYADGQAAVLTRGSE